MEEEKRVFLAKASEGYTIKVLYDVLASSLQRGFFKLDNAGIFLRDGDPGSTMMFDLRLSRGNFLRFECEKERCISFNLKHFHKLLKNVKKKDTLTLTVFQNIISKTLRFGITVKAKKEDKEKNSRVETNFVACQEEEEYCQYAPMEEGYEFPMTICSPDFQKIKRLGNIGKIITVSSKVKSIEFSCETERIYSSAVKIGKDKKNDTIIYRKQFNSSTFAALVKLPNLAKQMQFHSPKPSFQGYPLKIKTQVGSLGEMDVFIKDRDQIQIEEELRNQPETTKK